MRYFSSRDKSIQVSPSEAIILGISKDGGLFVPEYIPKIYDLNSLRDMNYKEITFFIMSKYLTDFEDDVLRKCIENAYDDKFSYEGIAPIKEVDGAYFLELYHGPTLAFKDMALSILPYLLKESMKIQGIDKEVVVLTATSGDTGKAALEGFANVEGIKIVVFFPENGVSEIQKLQMVTQEGDNTFVVGINGNFDDAQTGVKEIFNDKEFAQLLKDKNYLLSSANSINIGRLIPQIVYYFYAYMEMLRRGNIATDEKINLVVPTGNFGNILAAYYAKEMGLPINKLICASNENNILTDFLNTKTYDRRRDLKLTSSPSMDILISSNLERLLYHLSGEDTNLIYSLFRDLAEKRFYNVEDIHLEDFHGGYSTESQVANEIDKVFREKDYLMDPHTGVAYHVYEKYKNDTQDHTKTLIVSTASPFKFGLSVAEAIGIKSKDKDEFSILEWIGEYTNRPIPKAIEYLKNKEIMHKNNCDKEDMMDKIVEFLKVGESNDRSNGTCDFC